MDLDAIVAVPQVVIAGLDPRLQGEALVFREVWVTADEVGEGTFFRRAEGVRAVGEGRFEENLPGIVGVGLGEDFFGNCLGVAPICVGLADGDQCVANRRSLGLSSSSETGMTFMSAR